MYIDVFLCQRGKESMQVLQILQINPQGNPEEIREEMRRGEQDQE
jgi:hypothetical protein